MSRSIVLSNGSMHVGLNNQGLLHDFYFPYVGLENHTLVDNSVIGNLNFLILKIL